MKEERATLKAVQDFLEIKKILYVRINPISPVGPGRWRKVRASQRGAPDLIFFLHGRAYPVELKSKKGKQSESQKAWEERADRAGIPYVIIRCFQGFVEVFTALMKGPEKAGVGR